MILVLSGLYVLAPGHRLIFSAGMHAFADSASCFSSAVISSILRKSIGKIHQFSSMSRRM